MNTYMTNHCVNSVIDLKPVGPILPTVEMTMNNNDGSNNSTSSK